MKKKSFLFEINLFVIDARKQESIIKAKTWTPKKILRRAFDLPRPRKNLARPAD